MPARRDINERFADFVSPEPNSGCHLWLGGTSHDGYARIGTGVGKSGAYAHVFAWERLHGQKPKAMDLDHLCRVRCCVNPAHLELVTRRENLARGIGGGPANAANKLRLRARTHCNHGHEFTPENTGYSHGGKHRYCRACARKSCNAVAAKRRIRQKQVSPSRASE